MGKLEAFAIDGLECWFNSHGHLPAHFHVGRSGQWEIRVFFLKCTDRALNYEIKWGAEPSAGHRKEVLAAVIAARAELLVEWENKVCR